MAQSELQPNDLPFEAALQKLETLVEGMEDGDVPLAELVAQFEEGTLLLRQCQKRLNEAELRIEALKKTDDGLVLESVDND